MITKEFLIGSHLCIGSMCTNKDSQACKGWGHWDKQEIVYKITKDLAIKEVQRGR